MGWIGTCPECFSVLYYISKPLGRKKKQEQLKKVRAGVLGAEFPDPRNPMSSQTFLFEQISIGETMMEGGRVEEAVIHLSNAAVASGQPAELLQ